MGYVSIYDGKVNSHAAHCTVHLIQNWAIRKGLDAVIWTDLPENFNEKRRRPFSHDEAIDYLRGLTGDNMNRARQYIQKTPPQIKTHLRPRIKQELGW